MAHIRRKNVNGHWYLVIYHGNKFIKHLGREEDISSEKQMFMLRKHGLKRGGKKK